MLYKYLWGRVNESVKPVKPHYNLLNQKKITVGGAKKFVKGFTEVSR